MFARLLLITGLFCGGVHAAPFSEPMVNDEPVATQLIPDGALPDLSGTQPDPLTEVSEPPSILRDLSELPAPVRATRKRLIEIAEAGRIERLRGDLADTTLNFENESEDPVEQLLRSSGDEEGFEILAILIEVLQAGFVHLDIGTADEMFVWPYFVAYRLDDLTSRQKIELYRILTAGDVEDSNNFGSYIFYRVGIRPDGSWAFFVAGD